MSNRLIDETSPYLLQHAHNPVDWYPWGDEALQRAKTEDKPILLSVGYAACHWCHVMEKESFEDDATARVMNDRFMCIKVDREERPDIDSIYMSAVQAMTGHGGWPMTMFLTPDGKPFFGGTYFPPEPRQGLPSFTQILEAVHDAWVNQREGIDKQSAELVDHIGRIGAMQQSADDMTQAALNNAAHTMIENIDPEWGGFGEGMKFPQAPNLDFLLRMHAAHDYPGALEDVTLTLDKMARGGIYDQVGGGFHRYAVDRVWLVPHFEKMLYDNGQLLTFFARAFQVTQHPLYRETAIGTGEWMLREMQHEQGGFYSSLDADSEGVEGKFYVWDFQEFIALAGDDMPAAVAAFGVVGDGNWEGTNVLWRPEGGNDEVIARLRPVLLDARSKRIRPATDDKILAGWNGIAISGLAEAGITLQRPDFVEAAARAATFVLTKMRSEEGRLLRAWRDGKANVPAFLEDYSMMANACLTLYGSTFDQDWFTQAQQLTNEMVSLFADPAGGFFDTGIDAPRTVIRPKDLFDGATPSGNSVAAEVLLKLAAFEGDDSHEDRARSYLKIVYPLIQRSALGFGAALSALDRLLGRRLEIAIAGDIAESKDLIDVARARYLPNRVMAVGKSQPPSLLRDRAARDGKPTAYVCERFECKEPTTDAQLLRETLAHAQGRGHAREPMR